MKKHDYKLELKQTVRDYLSATLDTKQKKAELQRDPTRTNNYKREQDGLLNAELENARTKALQAVKDAENAYREYAQDSAGFNPSFLNKDLVTLLNSPIKLTEQEFVKYAKQNPADSPTTAANARLLHDAAADRGFILTNMRTPEEKTEEFSRLCRMAERVIKSGDDFLIGILEAAVDEAALDAVGEIKCYRNTPENEMQQGMNEERSRSGVDEAEDLIAFTAGFNNPKDQEAAYAEKAAATEEREKEERAAKITAAMQEEIEWAERKGETLEQHAAGLRSYANKIEETKAYAVGANAEEKRAKIDAEAQTYIDRANMISEYINGSGAAEGTAKDANAE